MTNKLRRWLLENVGVTACEVLSLDKGKPSAEGRISTPEKAIDSSPSKPDDSPEAIADDHEELRQLVGDSLDEYDEDDDIDLDRLGYAIKRIAVLPTLLRSDDVKASYPLSDLGRRARVTAAANLKAAVAGFLKEVGIWDLPVLLSVLRPAGVTMLFDIVSGLISIDGSELRVSEGSPYDLLLRVGMFEASYAWVQMTGEMPAGPFDPDAEFCGPGNASGAEFIYRVLIHAGWDCTRDDVMRNLEAVNRQVAHLMWGANE
jgi:hypothetical protein